ncbi:bifunctional acetate--CoA ligase family protein/GNAT family N-acetyltransferase [Myxosarcina sp. GI1]|uniref:bifunctional acetate--CoA ligase family protein/GNAT family N-acetyltransferase n=1 Tax=Myxosarcina sp. GI1 TaxID=1541065 RepID=UPI00056C579D|nr:bifunctional acetate--CoA ligase family protein/GNAT family N-acetyltransferase [Myxosarcina sp. GI1]
MTISMNLTVDPAHDIANYRRRPLEAIFAPKTVAVIGATDRPGSVGRTLLWNLISNPFGGTVFPVNPKRDNVLGIKAYKDITAINSAIDLAIIATPAPTVPMVIRQCGAAGVKGVIILSAGFREIGTVGIELERQILDEAHRHQIRIIGPNCLGLMNPRNGLNATFAGAMARPGNVGFISQSGALCTAILDWSFQENIGFSAFVSIGSMLDVSWGDLIYHLGDDPYTTSIAIYMESIGDARSFLSAAREVALTKPIIVIKGGRTGAAAKAAASHTGTLAGSDDVLDAAFRRCGVLRVDTIEDLFNMTELLAKQPRPKGKRLTILTNAGGPGVLATDALIREEGILATLSSETTTELDKVLPPHWSHHNPIDILGDATAERYSQALKIAAADSNSDGLLVILTPQAMTDATKIATQLQETLKELNGKPLLASWMGGENVAEGEAILNRAGIYTIPYPDTAAHLFNLMWNYSYNLKGLYETPELAEAGDDNSSHTQATVLLNKVRATGRTLLTEYESKQLLAAYGIPTVVTEIATSEDVAVEIATKIGYPVVLKLHSETITHKTDVGGVYLNLNNADAVRDAYNSIKNSVEQNHLPDSLSPNLPISQSPFLGVTVQPMVKLDGYELIIGSSIAPQFGSVLLFGTGGQLVEVFKDRALALPPLNTTLARRMMEQTRIYEALKGVRGRKAVDMSALAKLIVRFSQLVVEQPWIKEIDINPLLVSEDRLLALDARIVLHDSKTNESQLPRVAIRSYPTQYTECSTLNDGKRVTIRPIRPEDEPLIVKFHQYLSEESVYFRYFHLINLQARVAHERLTRICFIDYDREMALVADYLDPVTGEREILGVARLSKIYGTDEAEFGMLVSDRYQGRGLGKELLKTLVDIGRQEQLNCIIAEILPENRPMQRLCSKLGFRVERHGDVVTAYLDLLS